MNKYLIISIFLCFFYVFPVFSQFSYEWAFTMGAAFTDASYDMTIDKDGDIYIAGFLSEPFDFDPDENIVLPENMNNSSMYFAKYNKERELIFVKSIGNGITSGSINNINIDIDKNIYVSGYSYGRTDFDPGPDSLILESNEWTVGFFAKYDSVGNLIFAHPILTYSTGVISTLDENNNFYIFGMFVDSVDFDIGSDEYFLDGGDWGAINYLAKYDSLGHIIYAIKFDTIETIFQNPNLLISSAVGDKEGNLFLTGYYSGKIDFDPGVGDYILDSGSQESFFIAKYDPWGNLFFARSLNGSEGNYCSNSWIDIDDFGYIYITGTFLGSIDADPGIEILNLVSGEFGNAFFAKYDSIGSLIFGKQIINSIGDNGTYNLIIGVESNLYLVGTFSGTVDLNPGSEEMIYTTINANDMFIVKYNNEGNYITSMRIGGSSFETPWGMSIDNQSNIYLSGEFYENINLDPNGTDLYTSNGYQDIFVAKYSQNLVPVSNPATPAIMPNATPNPGTGIFHINLPGIGNDASICVVDMTGREVFNERPVSGEAALVDIRHLPAGVYFAVIKTNAGIQSVKLMKL